VFYEFPQKSLQAFDEKVPASRRPADRTQSNSATISDCYAVLNQRGIALPNSDLLPSLLFKLNENQLALEAAILELSNWVEQRGSADVADNVRGALETIDRNEEFIKMTLAVMMAPE
jgi:hypothetical protein